jgi:hypothetical protein
MAYLSKMVFSVFLFLFFVQLPAQNISNVDTIAGELVKAIRKDKSERVNVRINIILEVKIYMLILWTKAMLQWLNFY